MCLSLKDLVFKAAPGILISECLSVFSAYLCVLCVEYGSNAIFNAEYAEIR
jgi:hypothetical protein